MQRLAWWFVLGAALGACQGKQEPVATTQGSAAAVPAPSKPAVIADAPPAPNDEPPRPAGVLDLEIQRISGKDRYRVLSPSYMIEFAGVPKVDAQDTQAPDGVTTVKGAIASYSTDTSSTGFIYLPIPKDVLYDEKIGMTKAADGMLGIFDPDLKVQREPSTLGPLAATHVVADGSAHGTKVHLDAWISWDPKSRTMYGVMAVGTNGVAANGGALHDSFAPRQP